MKQGLPEFEDQLGDVIRDSYGFEVSSFNLIPVGDSAFSYRIDNAINERRYLKVFDASTRKGILGIAQLHRYLPFMMELSQSSLFPELPRPYETMNGDFQCTFKQYTCVVFEYIDGETLANAYPFSKEVQRRLADQLAKLHTIPWAKLHSDIARESYTLDFGENLLTNLTSVQSYAGDDPLLRKLQPIVLSKWEMIHRFWEQLCEFRTKAVQSEEEFVLCHGDLWGGNVIDRPHRHPIFLDWESVVIAPKERDLFSYIGLEYTTFRSAYAAAKQICLSLNPTLVGYYAYRQQLANLNQWMHNLLHENFDAAQRQNDLDMIGFHCLDRWSSIESSVIGLQSKSSSWRCGDG